MTKQSYKKSFISIGIVFLICFSSFLPLLMFFENGFIGINPEDESSDIQDVLNIDELLKASSNGAGINVPIWSLPLTKDGVERYNLYSGHYQVLDPTITTVSVGPYGINDGVFGSNYHVQNLNDISEYPGFEQEFLNIINAPLYPQSGTTNIAYDPFQAYQGVDAGVKNLLKRIGGLYEIKMDGQYLYDVYALPTKPENILINPQYNSEYHRPIELTIKETWETYTMVHQGTYEDGIWNENVYQLFTLYVPHLEIDLDLNSAFNNLLMKRMGDAGLSVHDVGKKLKGLAGYQEKIINIFKEQKKAQTFKDKIKGKSYAWIKNGFDVIKALGLLPDEIMEDIDLALECYGLILDMIKIFTGGSSAAMALIGMLLTADMLKAQAAAAEIHAVYHAHYLATLNYLKATIYAAIQIAQNILQNRQAFAIIEDVPGSAPAWYDDTNVYSAVRKSDRGFITSYNSERFGASAVFTTFNTPLSELSDYNGGGKNWDDLGIYSFYYAQYDTARDEAIAGEPPALYHADHCLSTFLASLVFYFNIHSKYTFDSKSNDIEEYTYALDIFDVQDDALPPDDFRTKVFGAFAVFGLAHNAFANLNQTNTLFPMVDIPPGVTFIDTDGDGLSDSYEQSHDSSYLDPDTDGDWIDDGAEDYYWNNATYMQGSTPTEWVDSDIDGFLDIEEIYSFGSNPTIADDDLDGDSLSLADELNTYFTSPRDPDSDDDYILDGIEVSNFATNPLDDDDDGDGIIDGIEAYGYGTDPHKYDSDDDLLSDFEEIFGKNLTITIFDGQIYHNLDFECYSDPLLNDSDGDGLTDGYEALTLGTLHVYWDTDLDGLSDGWEVQNGFLPLNSTDPVFQLSYILPSNPTQLDPGSFSWSVKDYYPREIVQVTVKYWSPNDVDWQTISTATSGTRNLDAEAGTHYFQIWAKNNINLEITYGFSVDVQSVIPPGPPIVLSPDDYNFIGTNDAMNFTYIFLYSGTPNNPIFNVHYNGFYVDFGFNHWQPIWGFTWPIDPAQMGPGVHYFDILVWDNFDGSDPYNNYVFESNVVWILDSGIAPFTEMASVGINNVTHGGIITDIPIGNTSISIDRLEWNPLSRYGIIAAGIWDQKPISSCPFDDNATYFAVDFFGALSILRIEVPLPEGYDRYEDEFILMEYKNGEWVKAEFVIEIDWIRGCAYIYIRNPGIFVLGKYVRPTILKPDDLTYVFDDQNVVLYQMIWTLAESLTNISYCGFHLNYDWGTLQGEIYDWSVGIPIIVSVYSDELPPGVHTLTARFYDSNVDEWIRHDVHIWVLIPTVQPLDNMSSARLYQSGIYEDVPLGDMTIVNITTLGAVVVGGFWNQNPTPEANPFNGNWVYFSIATNVPDFMIAYDDPEFPFIMSIPLPGGYDSNSDILTLLVWDELDAQWDFTDFKIEVDTGSNRALITVGRMGIFALGVVEPADTTPPTIMIEYIEGDGTDGNPGKWNVTVEDPESGINFGSRRVFIDGQLVSTKFGIFEINNSLGIHTILVEVESNNPLNPVLTSNSNSINLIDDDTAPPMITYTYTGDGTELNPGEIIISVTDASGLSVNPSGVYPVPDIPGTHVFIFNASDGDNDRAGDSLESNLTIIVEITEVEKIYLYNEDFEDTSNYWDLYNIIDREISLSLTPSDDTAAAQEHPDTTSFGHFPWIWTSNWTGKVRYSYIKAEFPYLYDNFTQNSNLHWRCGGLGFPPSGQRLAIYTTSDFDEDTLTWNTRPPRLEYLATSEPLSSSDVGQWQDFDIVRPYYYYHLEATAGQVAIYTKEKSSPAILNHYLSKNFQGNGYVYVQTDENETLTLRSPDDLNLQLMAGDVIEVTFNTTTSNEILLNLLYQGTKLKNFTISEQGNINANTRTIKFYLEEDLEIDQLEFTGFFEDTENLIIDRVRIYKYEFHPDANWEANVTSIFEGESVEFTFNGSEGNSPSTFLWDFGDGETSSEQDPIHQFETAGIFTVSLNVSDWDGDFDIKTRTIQVNNTPTGLNVEVMDQNTGVNITFDNVTSVGLTTVVESEVTPDPPSGFNVSGYYYDINTTSTFEINITVGIPYNESQIQGDEADLKLYHWDPDTGWIDITVWVDVANDIIYGEVSNFSVFVVLELDPTPPVIIIEYLDGDGTDGTPGRWNVYAYDEISGINETTIQIFIDDMLIGSEFGTYDVPNALGEHSIRVEVENANPINPLMGVKSASVLIIDDDTVPPDVTLEYFGSGHDGDPGYFAWSIDDVGSGLSEVIITVVYESTEGLPDHINTFSGAALGAWDIPSNLGYYTITAFARDDDNDRTIILDSLTTEITKQEEIVDDDTTPPLITWRYSGDHTDANPGALLISASDGSGLEIDPSGIYPVPNSPGTHEFVFTAVDADTDRPGDQLSTVVAIPIDIVDDDSDPPSVSNLEISVNLSHVKISFDAVDASGVATFEFSIDSEPVAPLSWVKVGDFYEFVFVNQWAGEHGTHQVEIVVTDADADRPDDESTLIVIGTFKTPAVVLLEYIQEKLEILKAEVLDNVDEPFDGIIARQLNRSLEKIALALGELLDGNLPKSVFIDRLAKINLEVAGVLTIVGEKIDRIDETFANHLVAELHQVRDLITLAMGASIGTAPALAIADVEVQINGLADEIYGNMSIIKAILIDLNLWQACDKLDWALVRLASQNITLAIKKIDGAIRDLKQTKSMISLLEWLGYLSEEDATVLKAKIDGFKVSLEAIKSDLEA